MSIKDMLDIYFKLTTRFDFLWNFYTFFVVAFGGYFISNKTELILTFQEKSILIGGYMFFISMNVAGLVITSNSLKAVADAIFYMATEPDDIIVVRKLVRKNHSLDNVATFSIHTGMLLLFSWLILSW